MSDPKDADHGPNLSGNPAAGNPDNIRSEDIPSVSEDEGEEDYVVDPENDDAVTRLPRTPPAPD